MPKYTKPRKTWKYSDDFKAGAVLWSLYPDVRSKDVASALEIHPLMLSRWRKEFNEGKIVVDKRKKQKDVAELKKDMTKLKKLEREIELLKKENDLLKKWQRFLAEAHQTDINSSRNTKIS